MLETNKCCLCPCLVLENFHENISSGSSPIPPFPFLSIYVYALSNLISLLNNETSISRRFAFATTFSSALHFILN